MATFRTQIIQKRSKLLFLILLRVFHIIFNRWFFIEIWMYYYYYYYYYYYFYFLRVFHISVGWWSFTVIWVTTSLFKSPELFFVSWPISAMQSSPLVPLISKSSSLFTNLLMAVPRASITIGITVTFMFISFGCFFFCSLARSRHLSFFSFSFNFTQWSAGTATSSILQALFFLWIIIRSGRLAEIGVIFLYLKIPEMLGCAYIICSLGQISISCTVPIGSPCPPSHI